MNMNQSTDAISNAAGYKSADISRSFIKNKDDIDLESVDEVSVREGAQHFNGSASSSGTETFNVMDCFKKAKAPVIIATTATAKGISNAASTNKPKGSRSRGKI